MRLSIFLLPLLALLALGLVPNAEGIPMSKIKRSWGLPRFAEATGKEPGCLTCLSKKNSHWCSDGQCVTGKPGRKKCASGWVSGKGSTDCPDVVQGWDATACTAANTCKKKLEAKETHPCTGKGCKPKERGCQNTVASCAPIDFLKSAWNIIHDKWQDKKPKQGGRGWNIGSVVTLTHNTEERPIIWAVNAVSSAGWKHGERLAIDEVKKLAKKYGVSADKLWAKCKIYTNLSPCWQCSVEILAALNNGPNHVYFSFPDIAAPARSDDCYTGTWNAAFGTPYSGTIEVTHDLAAAYETANPDRSLERRVTRPVTVPVTRVDIPGLQPAAWSQYLPYLNTDPSGTSLKGSVAAATAGCPDGYQGTSADAGVFAGTEEMLRRLATVLA